MNRTSRTPSIPSVLALLALCAALLTGPATAGAADWSGLESTPTSLKREASEIVGLAPTADGNIWFAGSWVGAAAGAQGPVAQGTAGFFGPSALLDELQSRPGATQDPRVGPTPDISLTEPFAGIAAGPEGDLWMTSASAEGRLVRVSPVGEARTVYGPLSGNGRSLSRPTGIAAGPDGAIWFTAEGSGAIGRILVESDGTADITAYPLPAGPAALPHAITAGPDGALWFTEPGVGAIGRITTAGAIGSYPLPNPTAEPNQIVTGPDGNLWFTEVAGKKIGRITPQGVVSEFTAETAGPIVSGPQGVLWFGSQNGVGSIDTKGRLGAVVCPERAGSGCAATVTALAVGRDGRLYLAGKREAREGGGTTLTSTEQIPAFAGVVRLPSASMVVKPTTRPQGARHVQLRIECVTAVAGKPCRGTVRVRSGGRQLGSRAFNMFSGEIRWLSVKLNPAGLRALARKPKLAATAALTLRGEKSPVPTKIVLRRQPGGGHGR
jgi:streptogramin lyase